MSYEKQKSITFIETQFVNLIKENFKDNLLSVILYGSILGENFIKGVSDINLLIILKEADSNQITDFGKTAFKTIQRYNITPLILTRDEFINSADVFPLEYMDIKERNRVIYGIDETQNLELTGKNLRHQVEAGLRGSLIRLRQIMVASRGKDSVLKGFFKIWIGPLLSMFRGLIRLKGEKAASLSHEEVVKKVSVLYSVDTEIFNNLLQIRKSTQKLKYKDIIVDVHRVLKDIIRIVDKLNLD